MLSESHVTQTLDDEDVYNDLTKQFQDNLAENTAVVTALENESITPAQLSATVITESYTRNQLNEHVRDILSFLEGNDEQIEFRLDYTVVKANIAEEVGQETGTELNQSLDNKYRLDNQVNNRPFEQVQPVTSRFQPLTYAALLLFFASVVSLFSLIRSVPETGSRVGTALVISGMATIVVSYGSRYLLDLLFINPGQGRDVDPDILISGATAVVDSTLVTMVRHSVGLLFFGLFTAVVSRLVYLRQEDRLQEFSARLGGETQETGDGTSYLINPFALVGDVFRRADSSAKMSGGSSSDVTSTAKGVGADTTNDEQSSLRDRIEPQLAEIETSLESAETAVARGEYTRATEQCSAVESTLASLGDQPGLLDSESISERLDVARSRLDNLQNRISDATALDSELDAVAQRLTDIETQLQEGSFQTALEQLESVRDELEELEQREAEHDLGHVKERIQTVQQRYDAAYGRATEGIQTDKLDNLRERIDSVNQHFTELRADIGTEPAGVLHERLENASETVTEIDRRHQRLDTDTLGADIVDLRETIDQHHTLVETAARIADDVQSGDEFRETVQVRRNAGEYDRALETSRRAQEAYEAALEAARDGIPVDAGPIEAKLAAVEDKRREIRQEQRQEEVASLRASLDEVKSGVDDATAALDSGRPDDASARLSDVSATLDETTSAIEDNNLPALAGRAERLAHRCDKLQDRTQTQHDARRRAIDALGSAEDTLDAAAAALDSETPREALKRLDNVAETLDTAGVPVQEYGFSGLVDRLRSLERRHERIRREAVDAAKRIPMTIPDTSRIPLSYDDIEKRDRLGRGGNADVFYATAPSSGDRVELALKEPRMNDIIHMGTVERMLDEAQTKTQADDNLVVSVMDTEATSDVEGLLAEAETWRRLENQDTVVAIVDETGESGDQAIETAETWVYNDDKDTVSTVVDTIHSRAATPMIREAEMWQQLDDHNHIVTVVDYDTEPVPWIAMEYMDGGPLSEYAGTMDPDQALWTAVATTQGVLHAHNHGVAHFDLKPQNVLLRRVENGWDVPKVADWGLSKHLLEHSQSVEGMSPTYAAPEQFDTDQYGRTDHVTDIYQLGAVFYELFTGRPPFEGRPMKVMHRIETEMPTPPSEVADLPESLDDILLTAMAKKKDDRYETVVNLRNDLQSLWDRY